MAREFTIDGAVTSGADTAAPKGPSIWARMAKALTASRQRKADSAIERYIQANGGQLTDGLERDISRRFGYMAGDR